MRRKSKDIDPLKELLKEQGTFSPSEGFSLRLKNAVLISYRFSYSKRYRKQERFGKWIIGILATCSLLIFVDLKPSASVLEVVFPVLSLAIGLFILILMFDKNSAFKS